jgi:tetratricopeptide (TPR) repeat protein
LNNGSLKFNERKFISQKSNGGITMNTKISLITILLILLVGVELALAGAKIVKFSGEVRIRRGVEESWQPASIDILLEDLDTILTGVNGIVVLQTSEGINFELGNNSILDISDLRKISEKELFLYLMSQKVQNIEPRAGNTKLRIGNVSVVHGESKAESENASGDELKPEFLVQETNGARALYDQKFYPNAIIKFYKILDKYNSVQNKGEINLYLGRSFEALNHPGQAIDAYQSVIDNYQGKDRISADAQKWINEAQLSIDRLKSKK